MCFASASLRATYVLQSLRNRGGNSAVSPSRRIPSQQPVVQCRSHPACSHVRTTPACAWRPPRRMPDRRSTACRLLSVARLRLASRLSQCLSGVTNRKQALTASPLAACQAISTSLVWSTATLPLTPPSGHPSRRSSCPTAQRSACVSRRSQPQILSRRCHLWPVLCDQHIAHASAYTHLSVVSSIPSFSPSVPSSVVTPFAASLLG